MSHLLLPFSAGFTADLSDGPCTSGLRGGEGRPLRLPAIPMRSDLVGEPGYVSWPSSLGCPQGSAVHKRYAVTAGQDNEAADEDGWNGLRTSAIKSHHRHTAVLNTQRQRQHSRFRIPPDATAFSSWQLFGSHSQLPTRVAALDDVTTGALNGEAARPGWQSPC